MPRSLEFFLGLLDSHEPAHVAFEDFAGEHGPTLRLLQQMGFIESEPGQNPVPNCPHCDKGTPYWLGQRLLCNCCCSTVDPRQLLLWRLDREAFLRWLAAGLHLRGGIAHVDDCLWQVGRYEAGGNISECFYVRPGPLSAAGATRLSRYRNTLLLYGVSPPAEFCTGPSLSLLDVLDLGERELEITDLSQVLSRNTVVRFDLQTGALFAGDAWLGEVSVGSKEYHLLCCLWAQRDRFVSYADLKHEILKRTGSKDTADEASFCQDLKRRIKRKIPGIDRLLVTTNKADGYRLRAFVEREH